MSTPPTTNPQLTHPLPPTPPPPPPTYTYLHTIQGDTWNIHLFNVLLEDALCFPDEHPGLQYALRSVNGTTHPLNTNTLSQY